MLTLKQVKETLPASSRGALTQEMIDQLNNLSKDPEEARYIRDNFINFSKILQEGKFKVGDYVHAVMYVSHKIMGKGNLEAYKATFPDRYQGMVDSGKATKDIHSIVSAYNKGILVNKVMQSAIIPSWILNQDKYQTAIQVLYDLATDVSVSNKVRADSAIGLITHLKRPEDNKAELKIDIAINNGLSSLEQSISEMSRRQLNIIQSDPNTSVQDIASYPLIDIE